MGWGEGGPCRVTGTVTLEEKVFGILSSTQSIYKEQVKDPTKVSEALGMSWEAVECWVRA